MGPHSHPPAPIEVKFCTAKRTPVPVGPAMFDLNRCNESPLRAEKPDFWLGSKFNTGSLPQKKNKHHIFAPTAGAQVHGAPDSERDKQTNKKHNIFAPTAGAHCAISPKLCMVIELVVPIKNVAFIF